MSEIEPGAPEAAKQKPAWRRYLPLGIGLAAVIIVFGFVLPRIADYGSVWDAVKTLTWKEALVLIGLTALNILTFAPPLIAVLPGLGFVPALRVTLASTASTYVAPGGAAVGIGMTFAMLRVRRHTLSEVTLAVTLNSVWNQLFSFGAPALALGLMTLTGPAQHGLLLSAGLIGAGIFIMFAGAFSATLSSRRLARWLGNNAARITSWAMRLVRRGPVGWNGESLAQFRAQAMQLLGRRWVPLTLATIAGQLTVFLVMLGALRVFEVPASEVSVLEAFAAWSVTRLIGSLPFLPPGGLGVVEVGLTGLLIGFGGHAAEVTAAVLVYRALTIIPTIVLGGLGGLGWRRHHQTA